MPDNPRRRPTEGSGRVARPQDSMDPNRPWEPGPEPPDETYGGSYKGSRWDRMAVAGFVCSLCVPAVTVLLIALGSMPSTSQTNGDVFVFLLLAGAVLWVAGLVLSLMAKNKAPKHHKLAKAGTIISAISPILFIVMLIFFLIVTVDWYFNHYFTMGVPSGIERAS